MRDDIPALDRRARLSHRSAKLFRFQVVAVIGCAQGLAHGTTMALVGGAVERLTVDAQGYRIWRPSPSPAPGYRIHTM